MANEQNKDTQNTTFGNQQKNDQSNESTRTDLNQNTIHGSGATTPTGSASPTAGASGSTLDSSGYNLGSTGSGAVTAGGASANQNTSTTQNQETSTDLSASSVKDTARGLYDQAKSTAGQAFGAATKRATEALDERKVTVASGLTTVADSIKQVGENLNTNPEQNPIAETAAKYTNSLASQIENLSGYFERKDVREMVRDVETFARRYPAYFIGGAVALGFLAARFLKSSNPRPLTGRNGRSFGAGRDSRPGLAGGEESLAAERF